MIHLLFEDGNSELRHTFFPLGQGIRKHLEDTLQNYHGSKTVNGYKRLNNLLTNEKGVSYSDMKRIKNFFDTYNGTDKSVEYILNGGNEMKLWVNNTLDSATKRVKDFKQAKKDAGIKNAFRREHEKDRQTKARKVTTNGLKVENKQKRHSILLNEEQIKDIIADI